MSTTNNPFNNTTTNIDYSTSGLDRESLDTLFSTSNLQTHTCCLICSNSATYKLVPKHKHLDTAEIQDRGYVCANCIQQKYVSPTDYKLIDLGGN